MRFDDRMGFMRSALIPCGLLLTLQQVAAQDICPSTNVLLDANGDVRVEAAEETDGNCLTGCTARDVPVRFRALNFIFISYRIDLPLSTQTRIRVKSDT